MAQTRAIKKAADAKTPEQRVLDDIKAGRLDESITGIIDAITDRVREGSVIMRWHVRLGDLDVTEDDLTIDEAYQIERESGGNWRDINPLQSAAHARALLVALFQSRRGLSYDEAVFEAGQLTVAATLAAINQEAQPVPLDSSPSTDPTPT
jgi:hypothetical protein